MPAKNEPRVGADKPVPEADIPDLKKKEKERKKAGIAWGSARPVGAPFRGALGGSGAGGGIARAAASATAPAASSMAGLEAGGSLLSRLLARLPESLAGKLMVGAGVGLILGAAGLMAAWLFGGPAGAPGAALNLPVIGAALKARGIGDSIALNYAAEASKGMLKSRAVPVAGKPPEAGKSPQSEKGGQAGPAPDALERGGIQTAGMLTARDLLANNLAGAKLTSGLGATFGGKDIFANTSAPKFGEAFDRSRISIIRPKAEKGTLRKAASRQARSARGEGATNTRAFSKRAMGQLKLARVLSVAGAKGGSDEVQKQLAADAFEQKFTQAGTPPDGPEGPNPKSQGGGGMVKPMGEGATDITAPPNVQGANATPYQQPLNEALNMGAQAADMRKQGMMLMAIGAVLIAIGIALMGKFPPWGSIIGAILIGIGAMLVGMGIMLTMMAGQLANQARKIADQIKQAQGQAAQAKIVDECMDQAIGDGTRPENCRPSTGAPDFTSKGTPIPEAVEKERNATWELEPGRPLNDGKAQPMRDESRSPPDAERPRVDVNPRRGPSR